MVHYALENNAFHEYFITYRNKLLLILYHMIEKSLKIIIAN